MSQELLDKVEYLQQVAKKYQQAATRTANPAVAAKWNCKAVETLAIAVQIMRNVNNH